MVWRSTAHHEVGATAEGRDVRGIAAVAEHNELAALAALTEHIGATDSVAVGQLEHAVDAECLHLHVRGNSRARDQRRGISGEHSPPQ